jgi:hypothetical protein
MGPIVGSVMGRPAYFGMGLKIRWQIEAAAIACPIPIEPPDRYFPGYTAF